MNPLLVLVLVVATAAVLPAQTLQDVLGTAGATLFEGAPFILAAAVLRRFAAGRFAWLAPLLGCGCGGGPAARSLPAAAATWLAFGPWIALARLAAAIAIGWYLGRRPAARHRHGPCPDGALHPAGDGPVSPLGELAALVPYGFAAGAIAHALPFAGDLGRLPVFAAAPLGAILAFVLAPCGLGAVGVAGALRATAPLAAVGFLCIAGIADARTFASAKPRGGESGLAYALCALACAYVAAHNGDALVHPRFTALLWIAAVAFAALGITRRGSNDPRTLAPPALMLTAIAFGTPAPIYRATATTLGDAFPGESLIFTGVVTRNTATTALVRYAITCCRADAAPIVVRLSDDVPQQNGTWLRAEGVLESHNGSLELHIRSAHPIPPLTDPYIYR
jgi:hypothetical protein